MEKSFLSALANNKIPDFNNASSNEKISSERKSLKALDFSSLPRCLVEFRCYRNSTRNKLSGTICGKKFFFDQNDCYFGIASFQVKVFNIFRKSTGFSIKPEQIGNQICFSRQSRLFSLFNSSSSIREV